MLSLFGRIRSTHADPSLMQPHATVAKAAAASVVDVTVAFFYFGLWANNITNTITMFRTNTSIERRLFSCVDQFRDRVREISRRDVQRKTDDRDISPRQLRYTMILRVHRICFVLWATRGRFVGGASTEQRNAKTGCTKRRARLRSHTPGR